MKLTKIKKLTRGLNVVPRADMYERTLRDMLQAQKNSVKQTSAGYKPDVWRILIGSKTGALIVICLTISLSVACLVLYRDAAGLKHELVQVLRDAAVARQDVPSAQPDDTATINFYLEEHRDLVARHAAMNSNAPQPAQVHVNPQDILYYESFDDEPDYMYPGIIVRGPSSGQKSDSGASPVISNGHTLALTEARQAAGFNLVSPAWLRPAYALDQIRRIEGRDALQLLYTDSIDSVSLFEQSLDGRRGLEAKDFREYAVYRNKGQGGGTILAWRDNELSYVLIGNADLSELMDMAQSISAAR